MTRRPYRRSLCLPRPARARRPGVRRPGIALIVALVVVLLVTLFLSEFTFSVGLDLRAMQTTQSAMRARTLARSAFRAVQAGLLQDEAQFFQGYRRLQDLLAVTPVPWQDGVLVEATIQPQDALYNVNDLADFRPGTSSDHLYSSLFRNLVQRMEPRPAEGQEVGLPLGDAATADLYAAVWDWVDPDDNLYQGAAAGGRGAEASAYFGREPVYAPRNGTLDRLTELRLVRGIEESRIPWEQWRRHFTVWGDTPDNNNYPGRINVNTATRQQIIEFLEVRRMVEAQMGELDSTQNDFQDSAINEYADRAEAIADALIPENGPRTRYDQRTLTAVLAQVKVNNSWNYVQQVFTLVSQTYRVSLTTAVDGVQAHLEAVVHTPREPGDRTADSVQIRYLTIR